MRRVLKVNWDFVLLFAVIFSLTFISLSYAEEDVTDKVELVKSRLHYDRRAKTTEFSVALKNISEDVLLTPIKMVIDSISDPSVSVANADGYTDDGKPYFEYSLESKHLLSNEATFYKNFVFSNSNRIRFSYSIKIFSIIPEAFSEIGPSGGTLEVINPESNINSVSIEIGEIISSEKLLISINEKVDTPDHYYQGAIPISPIVSINSSYNFTYGEFRITIPIYDLI